MADLLTKTCVPCEGGTKPLSKEQIEKYLEQVPGWEVDSIERHLTKSYPFRNFAEAMTFANRVAVLAEQEGHHPDLLVSWGKLGVSLSTHAIGGLSENDFILAAKIDAL